MQRGDRAQPVTIISPIHRWWALWLHATWPPADRSEQIKRPLVDLGFIHIAHWSLAEWMPAKRRRCAERWPLPPWSMTDWMPPKRRRRAFGPRRPRLSPQEWIAARRRRRRSGPRLPRRSLPERIAATRPRRDKRSRLPHPYVIFQSNFNDDLVAYIDAFALVVPNQIRGAWQGVFHFPGPQPVDRFVKFITERVIPTDYYYCAYPEASSTMIRAALELDERCDRFTQETRMLDAESFRSRFEAFLGDVEALLEEADTPR
jgi:hypothetical protein